MPPEYTGQNDGGVWERSVERRIVQRTWGRIHQLQVELRGNCLVVRGRTSSYYAKQLALEAALESLDSTDASCVELDIQVGNSRLPTSRTHSPALEPALYL